jgi:hypothetical protein
VHLKELALDVVVGTFTVVVGAAFGGVVDAGVVVVVVTTMVVDAGVVVIVVAVVVVWLVVDAGVVVVVVTRAAFLVLGSLDGDVSAQAASPTRATSASPIATRRILFS